MITAKNYAAHAERIIGQHIDREQDSPDSLRTIVTHLNKCVKFVLPDGGRIFDDNFKGLNGYKLSLPFDKISIEFYDHDKSKVILIAEQRDEVITFGQLLSTPVVERNAWIVYPITVAVSTDKPICDSCKIELQYKVIMDKHWDSLTEKQQVKAKEEMTHQMRHILELLEALTCRNVSTVNYQDASPKNEKRIKDGKLPFYETKMLVVDTRQPIGRSASLGGTHASPRQHLRRGHVRRLPSDNIWVRSCVVGDPTRGTIHKQYAVI